MNLSATSSWSCLLVPGVEYLCSQLRGQGRSRHEAPGITVCFQFPLRSTSGTAWQVMFQNTGHGGTLLGRPIGVPTGRNGQVDGAQTGLGETKGILCPSHTAHGPPAMNGGRSRPGPYACCTASPWRPCHLA